MSRSKASRDKDKQKVQKAVQPKVPKIDIKKAADEVRAYIDENKMNMIDYLVTEMEMYPDPNDTKNMPELCRLAEGFKKVMDFADKTAVDDVGTSFPEDMVQNYEDILMDIQDMVNEDDEFWKKIRDVVLPLYRQPILDSYEEVKAEIEAIGDETKRNTKLEKLEKQIKDARHIYKYWSDRWRSVTIFYDVVGQDVAVTQINRVRQVDGQIRETRNLLYEKEMPEGFVIKID